MPEKFDDEEDEEEDDEDLFDRPFNFMEFFSNPNKFFQNKQFKDLFEDIFKKIMGSLPPEFSNLDSDEAIKAFMENKDKFGFKGPFMAGFNVNFKDGKPVIDSFGNIKRGSYSGKPKVKKKREPLVEVNELEDKVLVIAEMPGVKKDDIQLKSTPHSLTISTKASEYDRSYYKEIELPCAINSDYAKARYQNGILEIKLKKLNETQKDIKID